MTYPVNTLTATPWQQFTEELETTDVPSVYYNFEKTGNKRLVSITLLRKTTRLQKMDSCPQ